jgi:hypothetical protein
MNSHSPKSLERSSLAKTVGCSLSWFAVLLGGCATNTDANPGASVAESAMYAMPARFLEVFRCTVSTKLVTSDARALKPIPGSLSFKLARWVRVHDYSLRSNPGVPRQSIIYEIGDAGGDASSMRTLTLAAYGVACNTYGSTAPSGQFIPGKPTDSFWGERTLTVKSSEFTLGVGKMYSTLLADGAAGSVGLPRMPALSAPLDFVAKTQGKTVGCNYQTADFKSAEPFEMERTLRFSTSASGVAVSGTISNHTDSGDLLSAAVPYVSTIEFAGTCAQEAR